MTMRHEDSGLPTCRAAALEADSNDTVPWRIDQIWGDGVGILGGPPKCTKSWFGLDMAVSLASSTPLLGRFAVRDPGPTLVYLAEDALHQVRSRIAGICQHRRLDIDAVDLHVITAPVVRLDQDADQKRLTLTVDRIRPKLLLLDPLVRLHRLDENSSSDISALLGFLRELQRRCDVAIVVVHDMRKAVRSQLGQALRGSGDLHAWNDHGVYLTRTGPSGSRIRLSLEHRAAPASTHSSCAWSPMPTAPLPTSKSSAPHRIMMSRAPAPLLHHAMIGCWLHFAALRAPSHVPSSEPHCVSTTTGSAMPLPISNALAVSNAPSKASPS
jgi:hypothetical protein